MSFDKEIGLIQNLFSKVYEIQVVKDSIKEHRTSSETKVLNSPRGIKASKDLSKYDIIISSVENDETNDRITRRIKAMCFVV